MSRDIYSPHRRRRSSLSGLALVIFITPLILLILGSVIFLLGKFSKAKDINNTAPVYFLIEKGESLSDISKKLAEEGLVSRKFYFYVYLGFSSSRNKIKADLYKLSPSLSIKEIAKILTSGDGTHDNEIRIIEGWTITQIASQYADFQINFSKSKSKKEDLENEFINEAKKTKDYHYDFLANLPKDVTLEGFLFPDTYELNQNAKPQDLIKKMLDNFNNKLDDKLKNDIKKREESIFEIITLASIVQKEVKTEEDMKGVAGVYYNRLAIGRELESDVTVNYVTGKNDPTPSYEDVDTNSPYNTYQHKGLPPGPVGNPGLMAIRATIYPIKHDYYYFLTRLDTGEAIFSTRGYEHEANKEKYLK